MPQRAETATMPWDEVGNKSGQILYSHMDARSAFAYGVERLKYRATAFAVQVLLILSR